MKHGRNKAVAVAAAAVRPGPPTKALATTPAVLGQTQQVTGVAQGWRKLRGPAADPEVHSRNVEAIVQSR